MIIGADKKALCFELADGSHWEIPCVQSLPYLFVRKLQRMDVTSEGGAMDMFDSIIEKYAPALLESVDAGTYGKIFELWLEACGSVAANGDASMGESSALPE